MALTSYHQRVVLDPVGLRIPAPSGTVTLFPVRPVNRRQVKDETQIGSHPLSVERRLHTLVAAGGVEEDVETLSRHLGIFQKVIAADGGLRLLQRLQIPCDTLVGDFDTLEPEEVRTAQELGTKVLRFPSNKNKSDLELAIDEAHTWGTTDLTIIGALGGEIDHCLTNFIAPLALCLEMQIWGRLVTSTSQIYLTQQPVTISAQGQRCSLHSLSENVGKLSLSGFEYPLQETDLARWQTLGLANKVTKSEARIEFATGELFITLRHSSEIDSE